MKSAFFIGLTLWFKFSLVVGENKCLVNVESRYDCGYNGITEEECVLGRACCWNSTLSYSKWCFFPESERCEIPDEYKYDCGYRGIAAAECVDRGCCWRSRQGQPNSHVPYCYHTRYSPQTEFQSDDEKELWVFTHQTTFSFTVQACENASIFLSTKPENDKSSTYQIIIGGDHNLKSKILKYINNTQVGVSVAESQEVLKCNESRSFYLSWLDGHLKVGTTSDVGDLIVQWDDIYPIDVNSIGLITTGQIGVWRFSNSVGQSTMIRSREVTTADLKSDISTEFRPTQTNFVFKVKACENVILHLTENQWSPYQTDGYQIFIGSRGNTMSTIQRLGYGDTGRIDVSTPDVLKCDGYSNFWVSWEGGHVEVGEGLRVGFARFIDKAYTNADPVRFLSVSVINQLRRSISWEFPKYKGEHYTIKTPPTTRYNINFHANTRMYHFIFEVKTCSDAFIYLSSDASIYNYAIHLGENNTVSKIIRHASPVSSEVLKQSDTPKILSCEEPRPFWISWHNKHIAVGKGVVLNQNQVLSHWDETLTQTVTGFGLRSTYSGAFAEWDFKKDNVDKVVSVIPNQYKYDRLWYHVANEKSLQLRIQACEEANIALTEYAGVVAGRAYELTIGANKNTRSILKDILSGEILRDISGKILGCSVWTSVWIKWDDQNLVIGTGERIGANQLMVIVNFKYPINAIGISSSSSNNGITRWEIAKPLVQHTPTWKKHCS